MGKELEESKESEDLDKFTQELRDIDLRRKSSDFFTNMTTNELLEFVQSQQEQLRRFSELLEELRWYADLFEIRSAKSIMKHWKTFNDFMDENEEFKEEWDTLCMAIRLKDD